MCMSALRLLGLLMMTGLAHAASFTPLGTKPDDGTFPLAFGSSASGVSADGSVVVGSVADEHNIQAFRWTGGVMTGLGDLLSDDFTSFANAVSADGMVVVGKGTSYAIGCTCTVAMTEAFRWANGVMVGLGYLPGDGFGSSSWASGVSADGSVVVGDASNGSYTQAFRWTGGMMTGLGDLSGSVFGSSASGVSADGSVVVGMARNVFASEAFRWTGGVMVGLGYLPGGSSSFANAVSADGLVVVGGSSSTLGGQAFRWIGGVMTGLGDLEGGDFGSVARGVSADGSVVVGIGSVVAATIGASGLVPFVWTQANGMRRLFDVLVEQGATGLSGWTLKEATGISADGNWVVGYGVNPNGLGEAFLANIAPLSGAPLVVALPDANANGVADVAMLRTGSVLVEIRDGLDAAHIRTLTFLSDEFTPLSAALLPDSDGDGTAEFAVLAARNVDSRPVVEMRNISGTEAPRKIWFAANSNAIAMSVIGSDADNNGIAEIAVLSTRNSDGRGWVQIKNAFGATNSQVVYASAGLTPLDLDVVEDADGNGVPEVAILATRNSDGRTRVEVSNASGAPNKYAINFMPNAAGVDLTVVNDADNNGVAEIAVLSSRNSDGRAAIEIKNAAGALNPVTYWLAAGRISLAVESVADADGNTVPEVAVLSKRKFDGRILVDVLNAAGAANAYRIWYSPGFSARSLAILDDLDNNTVPEAAVVMIRDSDGRILLQSRNAAGSPTATNYWFSP